MKDRTFYYGAIERERMDGHAASDLETATVETINDVLAVPATGHATPDCGTASRLLLCAKCAHRINATRPPHWNGCCKQSQDHETAYCGGGHKRVGRVNTEQLIRYQPRQ